MENWAPDWRQNNCDIKNSLIKVIIMKIYHFLVLASFTFSSVYIFYV